MEEEFQFTMVKANWYYPASWLAAEILGEALAKVYPPDKMARLFLLTLWFILYLWFVLFAMSIIQNSCLDEAAEIASLPSFSKCIGEIEMSGDNDGFVSVF